MENNFDIDITPSVTTYELYQIASYTHWFSIGEFIDNAITSALQNWDNLQKLSKSGYYLLVDIQIDPNNATLTIEDNAAGISKNEIQRALRAGEPPADVTKLSVHGVGMKMASFWWGRNLKIQTWPIGDDKGYEVEVDLDVIKQTRSATINVKEIPKRNKSGTKIIISKIPHDKQPRGSGLGKLRLLLTSMYRIYLNSQSNPVSIKLNDKLLEFVTYPILREPFWPNTQGPGDSEIIEWKRPFSFTTTRGHTIKGEIGLLAKMSRDLSGLFLHYKGKGMGGIGTSSESSDFNQQDLRDSREYYRPGRIFGQEGSYRWNRFTGEFDISELGKTSSTDSIKWDSEEEQEFLIALEQFLKDPSFNLWAMAENFQALKSKRIKDGTEGSNSSEFSISEVENISNYLSDKIHGESISHAPEGIDLEPKNNPRSLALVPNEEFISAETPFKVPDAEGHIHEFYPQFIEDPDFDLYMIESKTENVHIVKMNTGHPFVRELQWGNPQVREAVLRMFYLMSVPEIFLQARCARWAFREKINEIVDSTLNRAKVK